MTRDDIIRMAREAGLEVGDVEDEITFEITTEIFCRDYDYYQDNPDIGYLVQTDDLLRFAHLVYESVFRDANLVASRTILDAAVLEEREACAKTVEIFDKTFQTGGGIAGSIRARGKHDKG